MTTTRHNFTTVDQVIFLETEPTQSALSLSVLLQTKTCALFLLFGEGQLKKRSPPAVCLKGASTNAKQWGLVWPPAITSRSWRDGRIPSPSRVWICVYYSLTGFFRCKRLVYPSGAFSSLSLVSLVGDCPLFLPSHPLLTYEAHAAVLVFEGNNFG